MQMEQLYLYKYSIFFFKHTVSRRRINWKLICKNIMILNSSMNMKTGDCVACCTDQFHFNVYKIFLKDIDIFFYRTALQFDDNYKK